MANTVAQPDSADVLSITDPVYAYKSDNGFFTAEFASNIGTADAVKFTTNGYSFAWKPDNVIYVDSAGNMDVVFGVNQQAVAQVWKNRVSFVGTTQITTDIFDCEGNQLKHTIQMVAPPRIPAGYVGTPTQMASGGVITYDKSLQVFANGEVQTSDFEVTGDIGFKDAEGNLIYKLPMITVEDANGQITQGTYKVTFNADGTISFYGMVPWNFLQTAAYPVVIDPTVVVASAYDTSGNGGRKVVRLSNPGGTGDGWIVTSANNTSNDDIYFYVSKDNGQTWSQLCWVSGVGGNQWAIASNGTIIYGIICPTSSTSSYWFAFDGSTIANSAVSSTGYLDSGQTSYGSGCSLTIDGTGALDAAWVSKNATYTNGFNLRYSKGTVSGTTVTWATPTQVTNYNVANSYYQNPCIFVNSSNVPFIVFSGYDGTSTYTIGIVSTNNIGGDYSTTSSSWHGKVIYNGTSYGQNNPCAVIDGNGMIPVVWQGLDSSDSSNSKIRYSKSTDGGSTWSAMSALTTSSGGQDAERPSITIDNNNNLYVYFERKDSSIGITYYNIETVTYKNGSWSSVSAVTQSTSTNQTNPQTLWSEFNMNSSDAVRYMWSDSAGVYYDSITLNSPPNAPTNLSPTGGSAVGSVTPNLSGTFSDPDSGNTMSALQVQVYRNSDNTLMWDSGKTAMTTTTNNQNWSIAVSSSASLAYGTQYYWKATTWDNSGAQGAWSGNQVFFCEQVPTVTITAPTASQVVTTSSITAQLSYSQAASVAEGSYQFQLLDSTGSNVLQDSGVISGNNNQYTFNGLANNTTYQIAGYATTKDGVQGTSSKVTFSTSFTPPNAPTVTSSVSSTDASVTVSWTNSGTGQAIQYNRVYKQANGSWQLYQDQLSGTSYQDYLVGNGTEITYGVSAMGTNGVESSITSVTATPSFSGDWLYDPTTGKQFQFLYNRAPYDMATMEERQEFQTFGNKPMIRRGPLNARTGTLDALMMQIGSSQSPIQQLQAFEANMGNHPAYYLKTAAGEVLKVDVHTPKRKMPQEYLNNQAIGITVNWTEVS